MGGEKKEKIKRNIRKDMLTPHLKNCCQKKALLGNEKWELQKMGGRETTIETSWGGIHEKRRANRGKPFSNVKEKGAN